ncbi:hypothetical protein CHH26_10715 [Qipengyuania flava]|uniref:hypothetical protein n=1 Tax=Qipengyuania flava TaxID=192812 RepID=UPI000B8C6230|nr:hypothetical protein [Qipengyuania flava]ASP30650.1 hypothetical protein CHH26_10715 [Qipengyuania flava]
MGANDYWFRTSYKAGLESEESYITGRGNQILLRVLGGEPAWQIMTATASEDDGSCSVFPERVRLFEAALKVGHRRKLGPISKKDWKDREYVQVGTLVRKPGETDETLISELEELTREIFEILDDDLDLEDRDRDEMIDIYQSLSDGYDGGDIYLSDGVWLSSDGSVEDRGR